MVVLKQFTGDTLRDLLRDRAGNTLAIAAAALVPMAALIGGAVDMSRAYMANTQMQSACDSAVLAGRRAMSESGAYTDAEKVKADRMFNFNFDANSLDAAGPNFVTTSNEKGQVLGTATAKMPTLMMKLFDMDNVDLKVDCMAELQISNADVMFVLDTTGSMSGTRIAGLRTAVRDFHKTINTAVTDDQARVRYGFVPYSMTVNAKSLVSSGAMPTEYFTDATLYQSRLAVFENPVYTSETEDLGTTYETYPSEIRRGKCRKFGDNTYPSNGSNPATSGAAPGAVTSTEYDYVSWKKTKKKTFNGKKKWVGWCKRRAWTTRTTHETEYEFSSWLHTEASLDTSTAKLLSAVPYASNLSSSSRVDVRGAYDPILLATMNGTTASGIGISSSTWNGCIEERQTVADEEFIPISEDALDLNIDLVPFDDASRWKLHWADMEFSRSNYDSQNYTSNRNHITEYCPAEMELFRDVELSDDPTNIPGWLDTYLNNLVAEGNTYHDIGMIWGARLASSRGVFADNVNFESDKFPVSRHIIFMTDGAMVPSASGYSAYGIENLDSRIAPQHLVNTITARHNARFTAACAQAKSLGSTVWIIAFGTSMTAELSNCASDGRAYFSSNTEELRKTFKYIASQVADLRIGK